MRKKNILKQWISSEFQDPRNFSFYTGISEEQLIESFYEKLRLKIIKKPKEIKEIMKDNITVDFKPVVLDFY